jgi:hypothetical protein
MLSCRFRLIYCSIFCLIIFNQNIFSQFLEFPEREKNLIAGFGLFKNTIQPKDDFDYSGNIPIRCDNNNIYFLTYHDPGIKILLGYGNFNYEIKSTEEFLLKANYGGGIPLIMPREFKMIIPIRVQIDYLKVTQDNRPNNSRLELGDIGIGSGLDISYDLHAIDFQINYLFYINYSTVNFSVDYGYSLVSDVNFLMKLNRLFDDIGIVLGLEYYYQNWFMSSKKYNYYGKWFGGFLGINF